MPKSMKVLLIAALFVLGYLFMDLHSKMESQSNDAYIVKLEIALQNAENRVAQHSTELAELRDKNFILENANKQMAARIEGGYYQEGSLDE